MKNQPCPQCRAWSLVRKTVQNRNGSTWRRYECGNLHRFTVVEAAKA
jgi:hypothetical protein